MCEGSRWWKVPVLIQDRHRLLRAEVCREVLYRGVDGSVNGGMNSGVDGGVKCGVNGGVNDGVHGCADGGVDGDFDGGIDDGVDDGVNEGGRHLWSLIEPDEPDRARSGWPGVPGRVCVALPRLDAGLALTAAATPSQAV